MIFKPGQKIVCIANKDGWFRMASKQDSFIERLRLLFKGNKSNGPGFNEIVTVDYWPNVDYGYSIPLKEYNIQINGGRNLYLTKWFEPLVTDEQLEAELNSIFEKV